MNELFPALRKHGRPVRLNEGPKLRGKMYHLPNWNKWRDAQRLAFLRNAAETYGQDPRIRQFVIGTILKHGASREPKTQAAMILRWVQKNIKYYNETREQLQSPWYTLEAKSGDCDDMSLLLASFFETMKLPWKYVLSGAQPSTGRKVRWIEGTQEPPGARWSHIYTIVGTPFSRLGPGWMYADATVVGAPLGWDVVAGGNSGLMPEMGNNLAGTSSSVSGGVIAAETMEGPEKSSMTKQLVMAVVVGVSVSVLSQLVLDRLRK